jgi:hypothetical protein
MRKLFVYLSLISCGFTVGASEIGANSTVAIGINIDLLDCAADSYGFRNLCNIKSGMVYTSSLTRITDINLEYLVDYTWSCRDSYKGGAGVTSKAALEHKGRSQEDQSQKDQYQYMTTSSTAYFDYNRNQLKFDGYGDLYVIDDNPTDTRKSVFTPTCELKITKISVDFSPKQIEVFGNNICQINIYANMKNNVAIIQLLAESGYASIISCGTLEQKLYYLNRIKDALSRLLWVKQDQALQSVIIAIIGDSTKENSLVYLITHPDLLDFNIKIKQLYTRLDDYFKRLNGSMAHNVEEIFQPLYITLQNAQGLALTPELTTNLNYVYNLFSDKDISRFTPPTYCK